MDDSHLGTLPRAESPRFARVALVCDFPGDGRESIPRNAQGICGPFLSEFRKQLLPAEGVARGDSNLQVKGG